MSEALSATSTSSASASSAPGQNFQGAQNAQYPQRRRRPALSCQQCRRRKIKCDRGYPCGQCFQAKTLSCTYSPGSAGASRLPNRAQVSASASTTSRISNRARNSTPNSLSKHASSVGLSPSFVHLSNYTSPIAAPGESHKALEETPNSRALLDRIQKLEAQLAISKSEQRANLSLSIPKSLPKKLRGTVSKTRFFGTSHWRYEYGAFDKISLQSLDPGHDISDSSENCSDPTDNIKALMGKCKTLVKNVKAIPYSQWLANPDPREAVPEREISDQLVNAYFRTSESIYRILHIPSFQREYEQYWDQPEAANSTFIIKLLLVMSIGACFCPDLPHYQTEAIKWIFAAQTWLSSPFEKRRLHTSTIQIQCLLIIARQYYSVSGDLVWISAGTLLRTAIQMGFHRDPKFLPRMGMLQGEMRRRLWATILELNIQSSITSGMPLLISDQDWDTAPPTNIDDIDISETTIDPISPKQSTVFTQTSLQILLLQAFRSRLQVIRFSNNIQSEPSYDDALRVGAELSKACRDNRTFILRANQLQEAGITQLTMNLFDLSIRLFLLLLHRPFAAKGMEDLRFYFSRKICFDTAVAILNYPSSEDITANQPVDNTFRDDYAQFKIVNGSFFKSVVISSAIIIFHELNTQLEEEGPGFTAETQASRETPRQCLRDVMELSVHRIAVGENNVIGHLLFSIILAQVEAMEDGIHPELAVLEAAKKSALLCYDLLSTRIASAAGSLPVETGLSGVGDLGDPQDFSIDFNMQDWSMDQDIQESWLQSGCEGGIWWH